MGVRLHRDWLATRLVERMINVVYYARFVLNSQSMVYSMLIVSLITCTLLYALIFRVLFNSCLIKSCGFRLNSLNSEYQTCINREHGKQYTDLGTGEYVTTECLSINRGWLTAAISDPVQHTNIVKPSGVQ